MSCTWQISGISSYNARDDTLRESNLGSDTREELPSTNYRATGKQVFIEESMGDFTSPVIHRLIIVRQNSPNLHHSAGVTLC